MNKTRKITYILAALTILAGVLAVSAPDRAAAKWLSLKQNFVPQVQAATAVSQPAAPVAENADAIEVAADAEAEVAAADGQTARVVIGEAVTETKVIVIDKKETAQLQEAANIGHQSWLLDPVAVIKHDAAAYGFSAERDTFTLVSQKYEDDKSGTGEALVLVGHDDRYYLVKLIQPAGPGAHNIWQVTAIREVKATVKPGKPDVGPGVEGLDYDKVIKWQKDVDAGRDQWRLDPLAVAKREGRAYYGFSEADTFTVIRTQSATAIARHGQVDVEVKHDGKRYTMIIVRPFGGGGAIWTTYKVTGEPVTQPPAAKVIFQTGKYAGWDWYKDHYPAGTEMAVITDYESQLKYGHIPADVLARAKDVDYGKKVVLFAYLGAGGGADAIGIEKVTLAGNSMTVYVRTRSIKPGEVETKNLTNPSDFVAIDRQLVDIWGGVNVTFVDQNGKVLGKGKASVNHHG